METKAFANWTGKDRHLTRDEYIKEWLDSTLQFGSIFSGDIARAQIFFEFRDSVAEHAGIKWDDSK